MQNVLLLLHYKERKLSNTLVYYSLLSPLLITATIKQSQVNVVHVYWT